MAATKITLLFFAPAVVLGLFFELFLLFFTGWFFFC
jgi:hypothetical protein